MKLCVITGNHPRHLFLIKKLFPLFDDILVIGVFRENLVPSSSHLEDIHLKELFERHFKLRQEKEESAFGEEGIFQFCKQNKINSIQIEKDELNYKFVKKAFKDFKSDICVVMGSYILDNEFLELLPNNSFNIHLGLSPWYRGSATLFWPSYNLEPWKAGVTLHKLSSLPDGGDIYLQSSLKLERSYGVHDVAIKAIINSSSNIVKLVNAMKENKKLHPKKQQIVGRSYLSSQFRAEHLKVIYDVFDDKIVDYLSSIYKKFPEPKLITL